MWALYSVSLAAEAFASTVGCKAIWSITTNRLSMRIFFAWYSFHSSLALPCISTASVWVRCPSTVTIATSTARIAIASEIVFSDSSPASLICLANSCISVGSMRPILASATGT